LDYPSVRYAKSGNVHIAYSVLSEGVVDLVYVQGLFTHLEVMWDLPEFRSFCEQLSSFCRLIVFDKRGMGMSDRVQAGTLEERMDDVRAVMDAAGSVQATLLGESEGGPLAVLFAAAHPERTRALVLCGAEVRERSGEDWPWGDSTDDDFEVDLAGLPDRWASGSFIDIIAPSLAGLDRVRSWAKRQRLNSATPGAAEVFVRMAREIDVRALLPTIQVPTLVLHRVADKTVHVEQGRYLAANIPGARYVELPGADHAPWSGGADIAAEIREFMTGVREPARPERVLATVLFTDIVGSTERATAMGDRGWRDLLEEHHRVVRQELARFRGREIDTAGDGFLAVFDGPARALRAGLSIVEAVRSLGLEVRAGVHTGECEELGDKLVGIAVHVGARVVALAQPSQVLATSTVKDLVAGSGIELRDCGTHQLKGTAEPWRLFAVIRA